MERKDIAMEYAANALEPHTGKCLDNAAEFNQVAQVVAAPVELLIRVAEWLDGNGAPARYVAASRLREEIRGMVGC